MIKYEADHEGSGEAKAQFEGKVESLAVEAAVLVKQIYEHIKYQNKEAAEDFLSIFNSYVNADIGFLYEVKIRGD